MPARLCQATSLLGPITLCPHTTISGSVCVCVQRLRELNNFNTLMAVVGGLTHSCLARLSKTNSHIPHDTQKASTWL